MVPSKSMYIHVENFKLNQENCPFLAPISAENIEHCHRIWKKQIVCPGLNLSVSLICFKDFLNALKSKWGKVFTRCGFFGRALCWKRGKRHCAVCQLLG